MSRSAAGFAFAPNISWLLPDLPFGERPRAVAEAGFSGLEFGFPSHADLEALAQAGETWGLDIVLFNQDVPVWDRANRGYLVDPSRSDEFWRTFESALEIAERLDVGKVMLPSGVELEGTPRQGQRDCMSERLRQAAPLAAQAGVLLTIEVLNPVDNPGYFLTSSREALEIVRAVDHPNVRFQLDTYHLGMLEGELEGVLRENVGWIGHIQFADHPGRHEPGSGAMDFARLEATIDEVGYRGYVGLEYVPRSGGIETLDWVPEARKALARRSTPTPTPRQERWR